MNRIRLLLVHAQSNLRITVEFVHFSPTLAGNWSVPDKLSVRVLDDGPKYPRQPNWLNVVNWVILLMAPSPVALVPHMALYALTNAT